MSTKLYHIVLPRPCGPTFLCYMEKPKESDNYEWYVEETTLEEVVQRFQKFMEYAIEHFPDNYFPYKLEILKREEAGK